jgi:hypothetical protein
MVNGAYHFLDLVPKVAMRTASNSRWSGYAGTISIEAPLETVKCLCGVGPR